MLLCAVLSVLLGTAGIGWPQAMAPSPAAPNSPSPSLGLREQGPPAPPQPSTSTPPAPPAREENPGLINEMGKLFDKLPSILPPIKSPGETAKDASDALSRLAKPSVMITGRVSCPVSTNGAPDCKVAADQLCQSKGYKEGKSLNADSAEKCSPKVLIPGRQRKPDDCRTDTYVTRALCQ
jgi:hypothetical protein